VARWKLDETGGATAADATGHRLSATVRGPPHWAPRQGRLGGALKLEDSYLDCGDAEAFDFREAITVAAWMKVPPIGKALPALVTKGNNTWGLQLAGEKHEISFALTGPQTTGKSKGRSPAVKSKRPLDDGQWHQVVGSYDGQRVALYLDGELEDSVTASGLIAVNTEPVMIGQNSMGRSRPLNGWIDDVRLYGRGLNAQEVQALYRAGAQTSRAAK
jgi:large repetitive protein